MLSGTVLKQFRTYLKSQVGHGMSKFSCQEIESQYNLINMLLSDPEKFKYTIDTEEKDISYMPIELKKKLEEEKYYCINNILKDLEIFTK